MRRSIRWAGALAMLLAGAAPTVAAPGMPVPALATGDTTPASAVTAGVQSAETDLVLDDCTIVSSNDFETTWACPGYKGIPVAVTKGNLRFTASYGLTSTVEPAAKQTLPVANTLGPTIEWRLSNRTGRWTPFATIVRNLLDASGKHGEVLVVTRLGQGTTCQIAYVDARANPDAEALAQKAADAHGFDFDCRRDKPIKVGKFGAW